MFMVHRRMPFSDKPSLVLLLLLVAVPIGVHLVTTPLHVHKWLRSVARYIHNHMVTKPAVLVITFTDPTKARVLHSLPLI